MLWNKGDWAKALPLFLFLKNVLTCAVDEAMISIYR